MNYSFSDCTTALQILAVDVDKVGVLVSGHRLFADCCNSKDFMLMLSTVFGMDLYMVRESVYPDSMEIFASTDLCQKRW